MTEDEAQFILKKKSLNSRLKKSQSDGVNHPHLSSQSPLVMPGEKGISIVSKRNYDAGSEKRATARKISPHISRKDNKKKH